LISIDLGTVEYYDGTLNKFIYKQGGIVRFEITLKVVYDWEAKWRKPYFKGGLTNEEVIDLYMRMALDPIEEDFMTVDVMKQLSNYVGDPQTATTFTTPDSGQNGNQTANKAKVLTSEEVYAQMFSVGIDLEFENRNLNRLMTILRIIASHNNPPKKMNRQDILKQNQSLNAQRKAMLKSKG
jgi:hypothetical protein